MTTTTTGLPVPEATRPRTVFVGAVFAAAASMMLFLGVLVVYITERSAAHEAGAAWFPDGAVQLGPAGFILATLILSVVTVQWAVQAVNSGDRVNAFVALGITALFGIAVFNQLWFVIGDTGFSLATDTAQFMFFVVNGTFVVFMIAATAFVLLTFVRALVSHSPTATGPSVAAAAFYWHTVVAMWAIAWYAVYVAK